MRMESVERRGFSGMVQRPALRVIRPEGTVAYIVIAASFIAVAVFDVNVLLVIVGCAAFGLVTSLLAEKRCQK